MIRCMGCMQEFAEGAAACPHCGYVRGTAAKEAYHLPPESILAGRYIVGRVLGFGGFGVTYIGWDAQLERTVAIKEFLPTTFATRLPGGSAITVYEGAATEQFGFGLSRFVEEAQRLAQFNGIRGITDIYDTFSGNNTAYIVMEFLKGRDVKQVLAADGPLAYEKAQDIVLHVCDTLSPVHARGIIHRDISPDNIYLTDDGEVKLLDFGAARYESSVNSKSLSVILKSGYAPEEQYRSRGDQGPWTDVYALAATFYKMLTGVTPPDSMERAVRDELQEPSKLGAQLPKGAENALLNALNIRKGDRTQSVEAFKMALQSDEVERVRAKPVRHSGAKVPAAALVAIALTGVLLVAFFALRGVGVVTIGETTPLADSYGTAGQDGKVVVPNLTGMSEEEAAQALEECGLVLEECTPYVSTEDYIGKVVGQTPSAGREVEEGNPVTLHMGVGSLLQAMKNGDIPTVVGMPIVECVGYLPSLSEYGEELYNPNYVYGYSDEVTVGCVVSMNWNAERDSYYIVVSAGPEDATPPNGEIRAPFLTADVTLVLHVATPGYENSDNENSIRRRVFFEYAGSDSAWESLFSSSPSSYFSDSEELLENPVRNIQWQWESSIYENAQAWDGEELNFRVNYYHGSGENYTETQIPLTQTLLVQLEGEPPRIDSVEYWDIEEVEARIKSGELDQNNLGLSNFDELTREDFKEYNENIVVVHLTGDFAVHENYLLSINGDNGFSGYCYQKGELYVLEHNLWRTFYNEGEDTLLDLTLFSDIEYTISPDGNQITATMRPPAHYSGGQ